MLHGVKLPAGMAKVEVNKVLDEYFDLAVDISAESDTLGPCKNSFVKWRKELIIVLPSTTQPSLSLGTTPPVPSPLDLSQPLTFAEENHERTDVEGAFEEDQPIQQKQPSQNESAGKVVRSSCAARGEFEEQQTEQLQTTQKELSMSSSAVE